MKNGQIIWTFAKQYKEIVCYLLPLVNHKYHKFQNLVQRVSPHTIFKFKKSGNLLYLLTVKGCIGSVNNDNACKIEMPSIPDKTSEAKRWRELTSHSH